MFQQREDGDMHLYAPGEMSLLFDLQEDLLVEVWSYLDPSDLCQVECTCSSLRDICRIMWCIKGKKHLSPLDGSLYAAEKRCATGTRMLNFNPPTRVGDLTLPLVSWKEVVIFFLKASKYAEHMEALAGQHFNYDASIIGIERPTTLRCQHCTEFTDLNEDVFGNTGDYHFFVRLSERKQHREGAVIGEETDLIWQGFMSRHTHREDPCTTLSFFSSMLPCYDQQDIKWRTVYNNLCAKGLMSPILNITEGKFLYKLANTGRLCVTIVACQKHAPFRTSLVISTSGIENRLTAGVVLKLRFSASHNVHSRRILCVAFKKGSIEKEAYFGFSLMFH
jgi:hypothetical protein